MRINAQAWRSTDGRKRSLTCSPLRFLKSFSLISVILLFCRSRSVVSSGISSGTAFRPNYNIWNIVNEMYCMCVSITRQCNKSARMMDDGKPGLRWGGDSPGSGDVKLTTLWPQKEMDTKWLRTHFQVYGLSQFSSSCTVKTTYLSYKAHL